jgi:hypothetical protein
MNPGSLPAGTPKSTRTTSPDCIAHRCGPSLEPSHVIVVEGRCERTAHAPLPFRTDQSGKDLIERQAVLSGDRSEVVSGI